MPEAPRRVVQLPDEVANQIAAGEVVERPASVAKELLENAIDAEATQIRVDLAAGGTGLVRVVDDGWGMTPEDAQLALARHATSKIRSADDLSVVQSLGFRGEALPSIASVSRFRLTTRPRTATEGVRIEVEGGKVLAPVTVGAPPGTSVEVSDLFFNVPARLKFLKRPATEISHITDAVVRLALAHPHIGFELFNEGRSLVQVPPGSTTDPRGRLGRILGRPVAERLHPIPPAEVTGRIEVSGFVSEPELTERTTRGTYVFVNGRFIRDRTVQHAIQDGYRTLLERGRHPVVVLFLTMDPSMLDVNVHPQKTEVRFRSTGEVHSAVSAALSRALMGQPWLGASALAPQARRYVLRTDDGAPSGSVGSGQTAREAPVAGWPTAKSVGRFVPKMGPVTSAAPGSIPAARPAPVSQALALGGNGGVDTGRFGGLEPVGQVLSTYLICQGPDRMVVIDQHAAHERITFERLRQQRRAKEVQVQPLLVPVSLELDPARAQVAEDAQAHLQALGFDLEPFGGTTWLIKSAPVALSGARLDRLVLDLLDELKSLERTAAVDEIGDELAACAACHTSVRAGDWLTSEEIRALLRQMDEIDFGAHCPHGRPVFVEWSSRELEKLFHRS